MTRKSIDIKPEMTEIMELADKDFKIADINIFKDLIENINTMKRNLKDIKKDKMEFFNIYPI